MHQFCHFSKHPFQPSDRPIWYHRHLPAVQQHLSCLYSKRHANHAGIWVALPMRLCDGQSRQRVRLMRGQSQSYELGGIHFHRMGNLYEISRTYVLSTKCTPQFKILCRSRSGPIRVTISCVIYASLRPSTQIYCCRRLIMPPAASDIVGAYQVFMRVKPSIAQGHLARVRGWPRATLLEPLGPVLTGLEGKAVSISSRERMAGTS